MNSKTLFLIGVLFAFGSGCGDQSKSYKNDVDSQLTYDPAEDKTVVWDKQIRNGQTYLLTQRMVGFHDVMIGVAMYVYPNELEMSRSKYDEQYVAFDVSIDSVIGDVPKGKYVDTIVMDLDKKRLIVRFKDKTVKYTDYSEFVKKAKQELVDRNRLESWFETPFDELINVSGDCVAMLDMSTCKYEITSVEEIKLRNPATFKKVTCKSGQYGSKVGLSQLECWEGKTVDGDDVSLAKVKSSNHYYLTVGYSLKSEAAEN